ATVVGRRCGIRPKRYDDWLVVPNLWALVVGRPGILKTPALAEALRPLRDLIHQERQAYDNAYAEYAFQEVAASARLVALKREMGKGSDLESLRAEYEKTRITAPFEHRYMVNDPTVEKLGVLLNENPNGLLLYRDEIHGFLATMDRF